MVVRWISSLFRALIPVARTPAFKGLMLLLSWACVNSANASDEIQFLKQQLIHAPATSTTWVKSYSNKNQYYLYDQALAVIAFSRAKEFSVAKSLIETLSQKQNLDGSWYFYYPTDPTTDTISGSIAWMVIAINTYQNLSKDFQFKKTVEHALQYLHAFRFEKNSPYEGAIRFSKHKPHLLSIEHQIDTLAALDTFAHLTPDFKKMRTQTLAALKEHWVGYRFISGSDASKGIKNKNEIYLDTQAWAYLALNPSDIPELELREGLKFNCGSFIREVQQEGKKLFGFFESNRHDQYQNEQFIWSEGTLSMVVALQKLDHLQQESYFCNGKTSRDLMDSLSLLQNSQGGVKYANHEIKDWFSAEVGVASTVWMYFAKNKINPFKLSAL